MEKKLLFYLKRLIPLVGEEVFLVQTGDSAVSLQSFIVDSFIQTFTNHLNQPINKQDIDQMKTGGYFGISLLRNYLNISQTDFAYHYSSIVGNAQKQIVIHPTVQNYIQTIHPHIIITTSPFNILDEIFSDYYTLWFYPDSEKNFKDISEPTICHIFGRAGLPNVQCVLGEEELLTFLHAWNNKHSIDSDFMNQFKGQGMLVLGCDAFPDWIFRFLWYPLGNNSNGKGFLLEEKNGLLSQNDDSNEDNLSFLKFLHRINYDRSTKMYSLLDAVLKDIR